MNKRQKPNENYYMNLLNECKKDWKTMLAFPNASLEVVRFFSLF